MNNAEKNTSFPITVIIPVYNGKDYIETAIHSVLKQNVPVEIIIIDDCSTDETEELCKHECKPSNGQCRMQIRYIRNEKNLGVAASRNIGIENARGRYIAFLDADDYWAEGKLKAQLELLDDKNGVLCCTARELVSADGNSLSKVIGVEPVITYKMLLKTNSIACSSVLMKAEVAKEFKMCHDELHEDYILWLRVLEKYGRAYGINVPYLKSRMSEGGKSRNKKKSATMTYGVYRYLGFSKIRAVYYFLWYAWNGVRKYH